MYPRPQRIWVRALVRQFDPALAIFDPGRACGIPYAPETGLAAYTFQLLSLSHSQFRYLNWLWDQWYELNSLLAICRGVRRLAVVACTAVDVRATTRCT